MEFKSSPECSIGVELELQILNSRDFNLARDAADLIGLLDKNAHPGLIKPEITESMVELNTSVHRNHDSVVNELRQIRDAMAKAAERLNVRIAGGGSHSFHSWGDRRIYPTERFKHLLDVYGYLAKQFTIFGQHVHVGCPSGDDAMYLIHMLARYVPHFIALSASSPVQEGQDTAYQSSRLNTVSAFPLSGHAPLVQSWSEFIAYIDKMRGFGIIESLKDIYWDIRPKPEYGTVEIRVFDTPLTVERAALLAAYAQTLVHYLLTERPHAPSPDIYLVYSHNRFQACRYGLAGNLVDACSGRSVGLRDDVLATLRLVEGHADGLGNGAALQSLTDDVETGRSDARWLRETYKQYNSFNDVARLQSEVWMGRVPA